MNRISRKCVIVSTVTEDTLPDKMHPAYSLQLAKASEFGYTSNNHPVFTTASSVRVMHGDDPAATASYEMIKPPIRVAFLFVSLTCIAGCLGAAIFRN